MVLNNVPGSDDLITYTYSAQPVLQLTKSPLSHVYRMTTVNYIGASDDADKWIME